MAFIASDLTLEFAGNGYNRYRYDTLDALTIVDSDGYINNADDDQNLGPGDIIQVVVWATAVRTGTLDSIGNMTVMSVNANGSVDLSDSFMGGTITNTD